MLNITSQRDLVTGLNLHDSDLKLSALFYRALIWFSFLELHLVGIWNSLWSQRTIDSREVRPPWERERKGAKVSPSTCPRTKKKGTAGNNSPNQDGEHGQPKWCIHSHLREGIVTWFQVQPLKIQPEKRIRFPWFLFWFFWQ